MHEVRLAQKGETTRLKEIWKRCFGDPDSYIDFYFAHRYREDQTAVLLHAGVIVAMLTMIPVQTVIPDHRSIDTAMFYGIATHPNYQNRGHAAQLMDFGNQCLHARKQDLAVLVPANELLFDYYRQRGYRDGFYLRETLLTRDGVARLPITNWCHCAISSITPEEYNQRRKRLLSGRLFISYADEEIAYQKKLSQLSGADIYAVDFEATQGCLAVERISPDKVLIKEILLPEELMKAVLIQIVLLLPAQEYILRTPPFSGQLSGGSLRAFGMLRVQRELDWEITPNDFGYLGLAFD